MKQLELEDIKRLHDKAFTSNETTRERASEDLVFYWITHWDDSMLQNTELLYRGEFDILRKAGNAIVADLDANQVQVDFEAAEETREDAGEVLDGIYRAGTNHNQSIEAFENADVETIVCGVAAWELYTEYESLRSRDNKQTIKRRPIYEANNTVFWDPNDKSLDKRNSRYCSVLESFSEDGYIELVKELTGEELEAVDAESFAHPEHSYAFPWAGGESKKIYVVRFYHRQLVKTKLLIFENPFGETTTVEEDKIVEVEDDMIDNGYELIGEKDIERWKVTRYTASGADILSVDEIAGEHIPVIAEYGNRAVIEGEEHWEGITRLAKDPQRLRDFQLSYLADMAGRSPREKPIFNNEQIAGFEDMYNESGIDNAYPYLLQNRKGSDGQDLPIGPVGVMPAPNVPSAMVMAIAESRQAVEDVANPGVPQDIAEPDLSGKAVLALQARIDMQSAVYQKHRKHARRRDGEVYASMAADIHDVPREIQVELPDGTRKTVKMKEQVIDAETGDVVTINDVYNQSFNVYSKIGPSYTSQKEQTIDRLDNMIQTMPPGDPMREILTLKNLKLMDGVDFDDVREYANKQLVLRGIRKPETPEEEQALQQAAQQSDQPTAEMILAQGELLKGQAAMADIELKKFKLQTDAANEGAKRQIDGFNAETDRFEAQTNAHEAGAKIDNTRADTLSKKVDTQVKMLEAMKPENLSDEALLDIVMNE